MSHTLSNELQLEGAALLDFAKAARAAHGFGWLDDEGRIAPSMGTRLWITGRMTHCFALGRLLGDTDAPALAEHGIHALLDGPLRAADGSGWHSGVDADGAPMPGARVSYDHSFVILAAATGLVAEVPGAETLLSAALDSFEDLWWDEDSGMVVDARDPHDLSLDPYRGANANMHMVEALLAAWSATDDRILLERAERICARIVNVFIAHRFRLPEHFDRHWSPLLDYNRDRPADPFRPFGSTIGHWLEWSRLMIEVAFACDAAGLPHHDLLHVAPAHMYRRALMEGWGVDGESGFVYTVDFDGRPVVHERMYWVLCEAIGAAATLRAASGDSSYGADIEVFWNWAREHLIERPGAWREELDATNAPASGTWSGKPDIYHALQATLIPSLPIAPSFAVALLSRREDA
ncbi:AGE family epimerase/isomerase [Actinomyces sp. B33]|uniref:AGE family epimerase/isomerase n=1 Tax=Actinomyces sp. B33 TaxID=2942131 RepID=UPI0023416DA8|nr:AGE family epimerase/isomerase [Actinomyces sp. B33]MDC4232470.1 AGE family epimerase/isomerase [Actinomyces sp. B33]